MRKATAKHLAGLCYAYELWEETEERNDDGDADEYVSFNEVIMQAIAAARKDAKEQPE